MSPPLANFDDDRRRRVLTTGWGLALLTRVIWLPGGAAANVLSLAALVTFTVALIAFGLRQLVFRHRYGRAVPVLKWALALAGALCLAIGFALRPPAALGGIPVLVSIVALIGLAVRDTVRRLRSGAKPPDRIVQVGLALATVLVTVAIVHGPAVGEASPQRDIIYTLDKTATSRNPAFCRLMTAHFVEQSFESRDGPAGFYSCRAQTAGVLRPDAVDVSNVRIADGHATAEVAYRGGKFSGSKLRFGLVKRGEYWKVDRLLGFTTFDRKAATAATRKYLRHGPFSLSPSAVECVMAAFTRYSNEELQRLVVGGGSLRASTRIYLRCGRGAVVRSLATWLAPPSYSHARQLHGCVEEALGQASNMRIINLYRDPTGFLEIQLTCGRHAVLAAYQHALRKSQNNYSGTVVECTTASLHQLTNRALAEAFVDIDRIQEIIDSC
jgi:hypothetical protein